METNKNNKRDKMKSGFQALFSGEETQIETLQGNGANNPKGAITKEEIAPPANEKNVWFIDNREKESRQAVAKAKESANEVRVTLLMPDELHKKIKIMAHWELTTLKEIVNSALVASVAKYEKTHGQLASVPKSKE